MPIRLALRQVIRSASVGALGLGLIIPIAGVTAANAVTPSATAEVTGDGAYLRYTAAAGQTNQLVVTEDEHYTGDGSFVFLIDDVVPITAGTGCGYPDSTDQTKVSCTVSNLLESQDPYNVATLSLGDGNDTVAYRNTAEQGFFLNTIDLGAGNDKSTDTGAVDVNTVYGKTGNDTISLLGNGIADAGDGNDTVYADGTFAFVNGGNGNDVLKGGAGAQDLYGDAGNDTIYGGTGSDALFGGPGSDVLYGNSGADRLYGNSGNDKLYGGAGKDTLSGGPGKNVLHQD
jgi:Ca2+-binding RTX toxin-like protein